MSEGQSHSVVSEFFGAEIGDVRRERRLISIAERLSSRPDVSFPKALKTEADLEGFYRFMRSKSVTPKRILAPHIAATVERAAEHAEVLAVHDTSEFRFGGTRKGLGRVKVAGRGFFGHVTLAVTMNEARAPLGTLGLKTWARTKTSPSELRTSGRISYAETRLMPTEHDRC